MVSKFLQFNMKSRRGIRYLGLLQNASQLQYFDRKRFYHSNSRAEQSRAEQHGLLGGIHQRLCIHKISEGFAHNNESY
jgi:hypothetical protein